MNEEYSSPFGVLHKGKDFDEREIPARIQSFSLSSKVTVKGVRKRTMGGMSTFFPAHWSPQHIMNAINQAYEGKSEINPSGKVFYGYSKEGVKIKMRINSNGKISSAFPIMEEN